MSQLNRKIISGTLWVTSGQIVTLSILLISNIVLARLLSPKEFGQVGIIMFFVTLANVFTEGGLAGALIRKKEATKDDYSTVFVFNLIVSVICYLLILLLAGPISDFYNDPQLEDLLLVSSTVLLVNAFQITQNAKLMSSLRYKQKAIYRFLSVIVGTSVGIGFAYFGYGVWSLVFLQIATSVSLTIIYFTFEGVFVSFRFSFISFKELYKFGVNTTFASLLNTAFENIYQLILARFFSVVQVGYYYQSKKLQDVPGGIVNMLSQSVLFSSLSKLQDDRERFVQLYDKLVIIFMVSLTLLVGLMYFYAEGIILLLFGEDWLNSVFYLKLLVLASLFFYMEMVNRVIYKVFNKTHIILRLEILKKSIQFVSIAIGIYFVDLSILLYGYLFTNVISYFINLFFAKRILGLTVNFEIKFIAKVILCCVIVGASYVLFLNHVNYQSVELLVTIPLFVLVYFVLLNVLGIFSVYRELKLVRSILK